MGQQAQQQSGTDTGMGAIWVTAAIVIALILIWKAWHQQIVAGVFFINLWQAKAINFFIHDTNLSNNIFIMQNLDPASVNSTQLLDLMRSVGDFTRYPVIVILVMLAFILYKSNITLKFCKTYDMKSLRLQEQQNWLAIMPTVKEDLVKTDINTGPWAMALTPMEFARKFNLLKKEDALLDASASPWLDMTAGIKRGDAKRIFTMQLGPYWEGFERCQPQAYALAAVFMARINRDKESAKLILETIDRSFLAGKPDFSVAKPILKKYQNGEIVQEIVASHAYLLTVMASLLQKARDDGVVPSAEFLWLKPIDRRLWYMLNCIGRQTPFSEVGGPFAHWRAECVMQRRSLVPMIDEAIKALEIAVKEVKLSPKELKELQL